MIADNEKFYSTREVLSILGYSRRWLYTLIERDEIQHIKVGRNYRFKGEWINQFIDTYRKEKQNENQI